ncbi:glycosyltransferase family 2 protein [Roseovarius salinarum]|uniref:glycosyltransferase family 2 protein n=1 Tax=Roseovarius salinarum TaxID=1981892 RepID=UPI000C3363CE|nr:glycosyltransferase [Roseovarius salinarum]
MSSPISVVIPARNEAPTIGAVIDRTTRASGVGEVIVVDNASDDATATAAHVAGARVVFEPTPGFGNALRAGFRAAQNNWVAKVDADLEDMAEDMIARLAAARAPGVGLVKGRWNDPDDDMPMTRLLIKPAIRQIFPDLSHLDAPNSGLYLFDRSRISLEGLATTYAADIDVMVRMHLAGAVIAETWIGEIRNNPRDTGHYNAIADVILAFFLDHHARQQSGG